MRRLLLVVCVALTFATAHAREPEDSLAACKSSRLSTADSLVACKRLIDDPAQPSEIRAQALAARSVIHIIIKEFDRSLADINNAIDLNDPWSSYLSVRAAALRLMKDYPGAIWEATEALRLNPDDYDARFARGLAYVETNQAEPAIADMSRLIEFGATSTTLRFRAVAKIAIGDIQSARADLERALQLPDGHDQRGASAHELARADLTKLAVSTDVIKPSSPAGASGRPSDPGRSMQRTIAIVLRPSSLAALGDARTIAAVVREHATSRIGLHQIDVPRAAQHCVRRELKGSESDADVLAAAKKCSGATVATGDRLPKIDYVALLEVEVGIVDRDGERFPSFLLRSRLQDLESRSLVTASMNSAIANAPFPSPCNQACLISHASGAIVILSEYHGAVIVEEIDKWVKRPSTKR